jgi:prepilin-type N-terminal cleavage/methylation domain-containing protein/prepilin-type processing-associated H-X9-DG protein
MRRLTSRGFTLIELLVVVAIIAVLIAILLPSLGKAKQQAKRTQCLANLKAWGQAVNTYATEFEGWFGAKRPGGGTGSQWDQLPKTYDPNTTQVGMYEGQGGQSLASRLRFCPANSEQYKGAPNIAYYQDRPLPSYKFALYKIPGAASPFGTQIYKIQKFKRVSETLLMCDSNQQNNYGDCVCFINNNGNEGVYRSLINPANLGAPRNYNGQGYNSKTEIEVRHGGKSGTLFLDGHAESLAWSEYERNLLDSSTDPDESKRWTILTSN